jgi:ferredoxin-NADP reductase
MSSSAALSVPRPVTGLLEWLGIGPLALDDTLAAFNPLWTVFRLHARVTQRVAETPSACTLVLQTGRRFPAMLPGQHLMIAVEIEGVRHRRSYSPRWIDEEAGTLAITVQRQPYGLVSNWVNDNLAVGDVIEVGVPAGEFTLPTDVPPEILMIAGGSGITPCRAMIEHLHERAPSPRVTLLYFARSRQERIFAADLEKLAKRWPALRYHAIDTHANLPGRETPRDGQRGAAPTPVLDRDLLDRALSNWTSVPAYCCGPQPLMDAARRLWQDGGVADRLRFEAFGAPPVAVTGEITRHEIKLHRDGTARGFAALSNQSLLQAGEACGVQMQHGCRSGVCHECSCRLDEGTVIDLQSGQRIVGEGQVIRVCVSAAASDLTLSPAD